MSSLFSGLNVALDALLTQQAAMQTTTDNIANVNTPGYTRRRPVLQEKSPILEGALVIGRGVELKGIENVRDRVLESRIAQEHQRQGACDAYIGAMRGIEPMFGDSDQSLGGRIQQFFNSLSRLSTEPTNISLRNAVLSSAGNVARSFADTAQKLQTERTNADLGLVQAVGEVNQLTGEIAKLGTEISARRSLAQDAGALEDQRGELIQKLSALVDVSVIENESGISLTTSSGTPLVVGGKAYTLDARMDAATGVRHIHAEGTDITSAIAAGKLGGLIRARDVDMAGLSARLDTFAADFANAVNTAHDSGFDLDGNAGTNLFAPATSASAMKVAIADPRLLAASATGAAGDNGNLLHMGQVRTNALASGKSPSEVYASVVFDVGSGLAEAKADSAAGESILLQLAKQRNAISGVSNDEEAANLIRYQRAYEASAHVISTINSLLDIAVHLGRE